MGGSNPPLRIERLSFRYRNRPQPALEDVSLRAEAGQVLLVAGASGCGKSTLIRCINGLIPRSYKGDLRGQVYLYGRSTQGMTLPQISQIVGTLLQDPEKQILGSRVENEVAFGLENLGQPREEILARVDEALRYLGLEHLRRRETFYLSGGEKQKVALAGVLAMRPSILVLDEPLANLDPASAAEALRLIRRLADEGKTVIIVEHRVEDVLKIQPEKALFLEDGRVRYFGDVEGFLQAVDYHQAKLPAPLIMAQARRASAPAQTWPDPRRDGRRGEVLVRFENVSFAYDDGEPVLRDVSLDIHAGDVIALLGPNGAGKTTLVKQAIGLLKPTQGRVLVDGKDTREMTVAQAARHIGYVFQSPSHMLFAPTVRQELAFGPKNLGYDAETIAAGVRQAIRLVNLTGLEDYAPLALSFGQQKRVSIAAILAMRSPILVMDEPTAGQDYQNYMTFMAAISEMPFSAILFITHDLDLAISYANRVVLMHAGQIVADGPPEQVLSQPELISRCRLLPTSLLEVNLALLPRTGRFMPAERLAHVNGAGSIPVAGEGHGVEV
jgi:energy-coupling factor transporter ATP-binding protein EcfA2